MATYDSVLFFRLYCYFARAGSIPIIIEEEFFDILLIGWQRVVKVNLNFFFTAYIATLIVRGPSHL